MSTEGEEGEAVVVDLGPRGLLFVTLAAERALRSGGTGMYNAALVPFAQKNFRGEVGKGFCSKDGFAAYLDEVQRKKPRGDLPFEQLPVLVRFRDTSDPSSVEQVNPFDLAKSFGSGVRLKQVFIEITDDPLTKEIENRLPWLAGTNNSNHRLIRLPLGPRYLGDMSTPELLTYENFKRKFP
ncbi:MAG: hypothetical protein P4M07_02355 [Xanthobacteraceae bacterium]|nr:hypothetical protein [Xanthobacteraceae bacterium]